MNASSQHAVPSGAAGGADALTMHTPMTGNTGLAEIVNVRIFLSSLSAPARGRRQPPEDGTALLKKAAGQGRAHCSTSRSCVQRRVHTRVRRQPRAVVHPRPHPGDRPERRHTHAESSHGHPRSRAHFNISRCPPCPAPMAALHHVQTSHGQGGSCSRAHCSTAGCPPLCASQNWTCRFPALSADTLPATPYGHFTWRYTETAY